MRTYYVHVSLFSYIFSCQGKHDRTLKNKVKFVHFSRYLRSSHYKDFLEGAKKRSGKAGSGRGAFGRFTAGAAKLNIAANNT